MSGKRMFPELSNAELTAIRDRAYREAARCWREVETCTDDSIRPMLTAGSSDATMFYIACNDELERRANVEDFDARGDGPMSVFEHTEYEISGTLVGAYWWPMDKRWEKYISRRWTEAPDLARLHDYGSDRPQRLRGLLDEITNDGDSSSACRLTADSVLIVRKVRRVTRGDDLIVKIETHERVRLLAEMPSASDYVEEVS